METNNLTAYNLTEDNDRSKFFGKLCYRLYARLLKHSNTETFKNLDTPTRNIILNSFIANFFFGADAVAENKGHRNSILAEIEDTEFPEMETCTTLRELRDTTRRCGEYTGEKFGKCVEFRTGGHLDYIKESTFNFNEKTALDYFNAGSNTCSPMSNETTRAEYNFDANGEMNDGDEGSRASS